jgi:hypothetical protein
MAALVVATQKRHLQLVNVHLNILVNSVKMMSTNVKMVEILLVSMADNVLTIMEDIPANALKNGQVKIVNRTWTIVP